MLRDAIADRFGVLVEDEIQSGIEHGLSGGVDLQIRSQIWGARPPPRKAWRLSATIA